MDFVGIEKLSLVDFDNNLSVVLFCEGCNFRCPFCHNSSLVLSKNEKIDFNDILEYLKERKKLLDGVVISGGEPTLMNDLAYKCKQIRDLGYLVKLDTNGTNPKVIKYLIDNKLVDHIAMDIKGSFVNYSEIVGLTSLDLNNIKESINILKTSGISYEFRTTLVKEFHNEERIKEMKDIVKGAKKMYLQHFVSSPNCINPSLHEVSLEDAKKFKEILQDSVEFISLRGYEE